MYSPGLRPRRAAANLRSSMVLGKTDTDHERRVRPLVVPLGRPRLGDVAKDLF